jgi:hypothetical protein
MLTVTWITPPYAQLQIDESVSAGMLATNVVGDPGVHGAGITGMHGPGVSTPSAAAVNDAVAGLARLEQTPNGGTFTIGLLSMMFAIGLLSAITLFCGITFIVDGATPNEHCNIAPETTGVPMAATVRRTSSAALHAR